VHNKINLLGDRKIRNKIENLKANFKINFSEQNSREKRKQDEVDRAKSSRSTLIGNSRNFASDI